MSVVQYALALLSIYVPLAVAHDNGMDMSMDGPMNLAQGQMLPYLHFTLGDNLLFLGWVPQSAGAMVGACIGLFLLGLVDRWIAACRAVMEMHWSRRAQTVMSNKSNAIQLPADAQGENGHLQSASSKGVSRIRTAPPFIASHDLARGLIHAVQAALVFVMMLVVMTFQVGFILAVIVGLGVGETLFGRYANGAAHVI